MSNTEQATGPISSSAPASSSEMAPVVAPANPHSETKAKPERDVDRRNRYPGRRMRSAMAGSNNASAESGQNSVDPAARVDRGGEHENRSQANVDAGAGPRPERGANTKNTNARQGAGGQKNKDNRNAKGGNKSDKWGQGNKTTKGAQGAKWSNEGKFKWPRKNNKTQAPVQDGAVLPPIQATEDLFSDVLSGAFDQEHVDSAAAVPEKRVLRPEPESPKLHKILAQSGLGSRLEMEQLILEGRISVNNEPAHIGQRIQWGDQVKVNGKLLKLHISPPPTRVLAYHKPVGEVVSHDDPQNRPTVFRRLPKIQSGKWQSVGRLDLNTEGLLLLSNSGELANKLMHPRFGLEREYAVRVLGALSAEEKQKLLSGVQLDDGEAQFRSIVDGGGEGANCWYRVTIAEGRNREVRRMFESIGHAVSRLIRIRYGSMCLPKGLRRGMWMELDERDIQALARAAGMEQSGSVAGAKMGNKTAGKGGFGKRQGGLKGGGFDKFSPGEKKNNKNGNGVTKNAQPDPMKTSFGYIGADSFLRQRGGGGSGFHGYSGGRRRQGQG